MNARALAIVLLTVAQTAACTRASAPPSAPPPPDVVEKVLVDLEQQESALRASTDWATFRPSDHALGPDPLAIVDVGDGRYVGLLRGADAVVLLDERGEELARAAAPRNSRTLVVDEKYKSRSVVVVDDAGDNAIRYLVDAVGPRPAIRIFPGKVPAPPTPFSAIAGACTAAFSVLDHDVTVTREGAAPVAMRGDGPPLGVAVRPVDAGKACLVAVGMIEDHPLDRTIGSFGNVDAFLKVVRVDDGGAHELLVMNLGEEGLVTPKALAFADDDHVVAAGAGSGTALRVTVSTRAKEKVPSLPGVSSIALTKSGFIGASALLDAWVVVTGPEQDDVRAVPVPVLEPDTRGVDSRVGEALVFTTMMAPRQKSEGPLSRFTCETCHFEGGVDGRTHSTGRASADGDIHATTRPLMGLFNNKPLFTRALDPDISRMVHAEFRVASSNSPLDPWFAVTPADAPWLPLLGVQGTLSPADLRRGLMTFLHDFTPRSNPRVEGRIAFNTDEARGAEVFRDRCVSCHAARLVGDDPKTEQPFEKWQALVLSESGPLVWSSPERRKTGVLPYVHEEGARASSLRRLERKRPYFTNGSAKTIDDVLDAVRFDGATFLHASDKPGLPGLSDDEKRALRAFLLLL